METIFEASATVQDKGGRKQIIREVQIKAGPEMVWYIGIFLAKKGRQREKKN